jgi:putative endonuclease
MPASDWFVYIIRCANNSLYTGITTNIERRFQEHQGHSKGAKALKGKGPLALVWTTPMSDRSQASKLEYGIKQLSKADKERLVSGDNSLLPDIK